MVLALLAAGLAASAVAGPGRRDIDRWRRGAAGEEWTAGLLDGLPRRRWAVWHDLPVPGSRANIDHLVVGPTGVWVVDTKTTRAEVRSGWRSVRLGDRRLDVAPTRWEAEVVADRLAAELGDEAVRTGAVRAVVALHSPSVRGDGGGLRPRGRKVDGVPVVPAGALLRRLRRGRRRLAGRDRRVVGEALQRCFGAPGGGRL